MGRDMGPILDRLDKQAAENAELKQENEQLKEWIATVVNSYHHVMTYGLVHDGVALVNRPKAIDPTAIHEPKKEV